MGNLLSHAGIRLSEPMLFGIGEGLGFIYWNSKGMDFPFIGGRVKPDELTTRIAQRLNLQLNVSETTSSAKAWLHVKGSIDRGIPVGLKLDCYHLDYFNSKVHFAAHYIAMYGYDEEYAYVADTSQQGDMTKTRLSTLALARSERGPMSSRNLSYTIDKTSALPQLDSLLRASISSNAYQYLNPPIRNIGIRGIETMSKAVLKWPTSDDPNLAHHLGMTALMMERGGTGGALFRNLYRDFLLESLEVLGDSRIEQAYQQFIGIAQLWNEVSASIDHAGRSGNLDELRRTSELLMQTARKEREAMELLLDIDK
nr:BtrH N-terminal domain-containing protein [Paenibacillus sp. YPG26]